MENTNRYQVYPNMRGKDRNDNSDERRGSLRIGYVENNTDMQEQGIANDFAAVTYEENGMVRFYVLTFNAPGSLFPDVPTWVGPYMAYSEEIVADKESDYENEAKL